MATAAKTESRLIEGTFITEWMYGGEAYVYAANPSKTRLVRVQKSLEKEGFQDVQIEPVMKADSIIGYSLAGKKPVVKEQAS